MFKVEISFNKELSDVDEMCAATDEIFGRYGLPCVVREKGERVYTDGGERADIGKLWAAVGKVAHIAWIVRGIADATWENAVYRPARRESLMDNVFDGRFCAG